MPMPRPGQNESKQRFIERFMGDPDMVREFPDPSQRRAVAERQFRRVRLRR